MRNTRNSLFAGFFFTVAWLGACDDSQPSSPELTSVRAAKGGGKPVKVNATDPASGEQGTISLDVRVIGSGFDDGSSGPPQVTWLLDSDPTGVTTNSVAFGADPNTELLTNVTIEPDSRLGLWDVEVQTMRGKKGIGMEKFEVKVHNAPGQTDPIPLTVTFGDTPGDRIRSDDEVLSWPLGSTTYVGGSPGVDAVIMSNGNFRIDLDPTNCVWKKKPRSPCDFRLYTVELSEPLLEPVPAGMRLPSFCPEGSTECIGHAPGYMTTSRPDPGFENGFRSMSPGQTMTTNLFAWFNYYWTGTTRVEDPDFGWSLAWGGDCGPNDAIPENRALVTAGADTDGDGEPDSWTIEAGASGEALLCSMPDKGRGGWTRVSRLNAPFRMTLTRQP